MNGYVYFATVESFLRADWVMLLDQEEWSYLRSYHQKIIKRLQNCYSAECIDIMTDIQP